MSTQTQVVHLAVLGVGKLMKFPPCNQTLILPCWLVLSKGGESGNSANITKYYHSQKDTTPYCKSCPLDFEEGW